MSVSQAHCTISGDYSEEVHLFSFRTQKLSSSAPKILAGQPAGKIGRCQIPLKKSFSYERAFLFVYNKFCYIIPLFFANIVSFFNILTNC